MKPVDFKQSNGTLLGGPADRFGTDQDVGDLPVFRDGSLIVSCWSLPLRERLALLFRGRLWLLVYASKTHAPVGLQAEDPFGG